MATFSDLTDKVTKILNIGVNPALCVEVVLYRKTRGPVLHFQGTIGRRNMGQIYDSIKPDDMEFNNGWDVEKLETLVQMWKRWHVNDLRAGSPAQMEHLRIIQATTGLKLSYEQACEALKDADLWVDKNFIFVPDFALEGADYSTGYRYGSAWIFEELPQSVIDWFNGL